jgi:hypothetical protein
MPGATRIRRAGQRGLPIRVFAVLAVMVIWVDTPAGADERTRQHSAIDREVTFTDSGCGLVQKKTITLPRTAREVQIDQPPVGDLLRDAVTDQVVARVLSVTQVETDGRPVVSVEAQSSDAACDPASSVATNWSTSAALLGSYITLEKVYVTGSGRGDSRAYKPKVLPFGMRSALVGVRWRGWGSPKAVGRANVEFNSCIPNCAESPPAYYPVRATLTKRRKCDGYVQYRVLRFRYISSSRPPGLPATYREAFGCG